MSNGTIEQLVLRSRTATQIDLREIAQQLLAFNQPTEVDAAIKEHLEPKQATKLRGIFLEMAQAKGF